MLISMAREGNNLRAFSFCTLERIGGTPCVLLGCASVKRTSKRDAVLRALMTDQFRRAVLAFPDEDVLVGTRFAGASGYEAFKNLEDIVPRPDHKATGEERAWGRRLAKRFGADGRIDDRTFVVTGDGCESGGFDFISPKAAAGSEECAFFEGVDAAAGGRLVTFGWALAEDLAGGKLGGR